MIDSEVIAKDITLADGLNEYLALRQIDKRKYYPSYLIAAKNVWKDLFEGTIYSMNSIWKPLKKGDPYLYVDLPKDCQRLFSVSIEDHCGDIKPIYYNNRLNVVSKPTEKKCGCDSCNCGGLCSDVNSTVLNTRILFSLNGVNYIEKTWVKYCPNGDMVEYKEIPTKKYNDFRGDGGDYNADYNGDFSSNNSAFSNYDIVVNTTQRKICSLTTQPCGCPEETPENEAILIEHCGCFLPFFGHHRRHHCDHFLTDTNTEKYGAVKLSECGTKIFYRPSHRHHHHHLKENKLPDFLLISYQTNSEPTSITDQVVMPDVYAYKNCLWTGIDFMSKRFNNKYPANEKQLAKYEYNDASNKLIGYLNPLNFEDLGDIQDLPIRY